MAAGYQSLTILGLWLSVGQGVRRVDEIAGGIATLCAFCLMVLFARDARRGGVVTRAEAWCAMLLAVNPLWPGLPIAIGVWQSGTGWDVGHVLTVMIGVLVFHTAAGLVLADAFMRRAVRSDDTWRSYLSTPSERSGALLGLSMLSGGWTGAFGLIAALIRYDFDLSVRFTDVMKALAFSHIGYALGMVLGFFAALFTATIPARTRLDRSALPLFGVPFVLGVVGSAVHPVVGLLAAGLGAIGSSVYVARRHRAIRPGRCHVCGYNLRGLHADACPECGTDIRQARALILASGRDAPDAPR